MATKDYAPTNNKYNENKRKDKSGLSGKTSGKEHCVL